MRDTTATTLSRGILDTHSRLGRTRGLNEAQDRPLRLLILQTALFGSTGGIQTFNRALVRATGDLASVRGISTRVLVLNDASVPQCANGIKVFGGDKARFALACLAEARRADVALFTHVNLSPIAWILKKVRSDARRCLVVHGVDVWRRLSAPRRAGVASMDRVLSVSRYTLDVMRERNGALPVASSVFPCTLDASVVETDGGAAEEEVPKGRFLLSVARLAETERRKGIDVVLRALPAVRRAHPDALYVVAGDGADRERLQRLARDLGVASSVTFLGRVSDARLAALYARCEAFVLPSTKEGFGIVFLEAMSRARPCVGARAGGVPEVILDGETGFLATPDDPADLARCLNRLLGDARLAERLGTAGRERFCAVFAPEQFAARLAGVLDDLTVAERVRWSDTRETER